MTEPQLAETKPKLPDALTTDQVFLRLIIERLDLSNALLIDLCTYATQCNDLLGRVDNSIIDVETAIEKAKAVNVNFDIDKLAERLNLAKPSALEADLQAKRVARTKTK